MSDVGEQIGRLVEPMIGRDLWVCVSEPVPESDQSTVPDHLVEHLEHLIGWERRGVLFAAGPFLDDAGLPGDSALYVLRADSLEEARELADGEPLHRAGLRRYTLRAWRINEGRISLSIDFSRQAAGLDGEPGPTPKGAS